MKNEFESRETSLYRYLFLLSANNLFRIFPRMAHNMLCFVNVSNHQRPDLLNLKSMKLFTHSLLDT